MLKTVVATNGRITTFSADASLSVEVAASQMVGFSIAAVGGADDAVVVVAVGSSVGVTAALLTLALRLALPLAPL